LNYLVGLVGMYKCVECGDEVPQKDIDRGFAFFDGKSAYCYKCVGKYLLKMEQMRRAADFSAALEAATKRASEQREDIEKLKQHTKKVSFLVLLVFLIIVLIITLCSAYLVLKLCSRT